MYVSPYIFHRPVQAGSCQAPGRYMPTCLHASVGGTYCNSVVTAFTIATRGVRDWGVAASVVKGTAYGTVCCHEPTYARVHCVPNTFQPSRDPSTGWRYHSTGAGDATQY